MQTQYSVLVYRIDLYFHDYKLAIKKQKVIERELRCKFIRIDPEKENFDIFKSINEIFRHIKQSTKKVWVKLLGFPSYENNGNVLYQL